MWTYRLRKVFTFAKWPLKFLKERDFIVNLDRKSVQDNKPIIKRLVVAYSLRFLHVDNGNYFFGVGFNASKSNHEARNLLNIILKAHLVDSSLCCTS